jgi:hypothetical protein
VSDLSEWVIVIDLEFGAFSSRVTMMQQMMSRREGKCHAHAQSDSTIQNSLVMTFKKATKQYKKLAT